MTHSRSAGAELLAAATVALPATTLGQAQGRAPRIGDLVFRSHADEPEAAFVAGLREQGQVEGPDIVVGWRLAGGRGGNLLQRAAELAARRVDLVVAGSFQSLQATAAATKTVPVIFIAGAAAVGSGFVTGLSWPDANVTGFSNPAANLPAKQIELPQAVRPRLSG